MSVNAGEVLFSLAAQDTASAVMLKVKVSLEGLGQSAGKQTAAVSGISKAIGGLGSVASAPIRALGGLTDILGKVGLAGLGITTLASTVGTLATSLVGGNAEMERYTVQLTTLMGSADLAKDRLAELARFGAATPFELPELVRAEKVLLGFGLTGQKALEMTGRSGEELRTLIGDIAAGTGQSFEEIALNFGKFSAGATGVSISRLQELGVVTREQMAAMGIEFSKAGELLSPLPIAMEAAATIASKKFGGGMEALSKTFEGQMSTLSDNFNQAKNVITQPIFDNLKSGLAGVNTLFSSEAFQNGLKNFAATLAGVVSSAVTSAVDLFGKLGGVLQALVGYFSAVIEDGDTLNDFLSHLPGFAQPVVKAIGDIVAIIQSLLGYLSADNDFDLMGSWFGPDIGPLIDNVVRSFKSLIDPILAIGAAIGGLISGDLNLGEFLGEMLAAALDHLGNLANFAVLFGELAITLDLAFIEMVGNINWAGVGATLLSGLQGALAFLVDAASSAGTAVLDFGAMILGSIASVDWASVGQTLLTGLGGALSLLAEGATAAGQGLLDLGGIILGAIGSIPWADVGQAILTGITGALAAVGDIGASMQPLLDSVTGWITSVAPSILPAASTWRDAMLSWTETSGLDMVTHLGIGLAQVVGFISEQAAPLVSAFTTWATAFTSWIPGAVVSFLAAWPTMLNTILDNIEVVAADIAVKVGEWAVAIGSWLGPAVALLWENLPEILLAIGGIIAAVAIFIAESASVITARLATWVIAFLGWILPLIPPLLLELGKLLNAITAWILLTAVPAIAAQLLKWADEFWKWIGATAIPKIQEELPKVLAALVVWLNATAITIGLEIEKWVPKFTAWVGTVATNLTTVELPKILTAISGWITTTAASITAEAQKIGDNIIAGIRNGISAGLAGLIEQAKGIAGSVIGAATGALGIGSPSRVFYGIGQNVILGLRNGLADTASQATAAAGDAAQGIIDGFTDSGIQPALRDYFGFILEEGDWLNDSLTELPAKLRPALEGIGLAFSTLLENPMIANAEGGTQALGNYFQAIIDDGDFLNDWLTHLPEKLRSVLAFLGETFAETIGVPLELIPAQAEASMAAVTATLTNPEIAENVALTWQEIAAMATVPLAELPFEAKLRADRATYLLKNPDMSDIATTWQEIAAMATMPLADLPFEAKLRADLATYLLKNPALSGIAETWEEIAVTATVPLTESFVAMDETVQDVMANMADFVTGRFDAIVGAAASAAAAIAAFAASAKASFDSMAAYTGGNTSTTGATSDNGATQVQSSGASSSQAPVINYNVTTTANVNPAADYHILMALAGRA